MKEIAIESKSERTRFMFYLLSIIIALLSFFTEDGTLFYTLLALIFISYSKVEKANNRFLKFAGIFTYVIYFAWFGYKVIFWFNTNFIA